jgi:hypothetical protein
MNARKFARQLSDRAAQLSRAHRRIRNTGLIVVAAVAVYVLLGFLGGPILLRHIASGSIANSLKRTVTVGAASSNPFTLNFNLYKLHIAERDSPRAFVDIARLHLKVAWSSLIHLAPIVKELTVDQPAVNVARIDKQHFNFSDLIESRPTAAAPSKPTRFAVSNIRVNDGEVRFDDWVLGQHHTLSHIQIGVPFLANLPADTDVYVQPMVHMVVDGRPLKIDGTALPFATPPESTLDVRLHRLELPLYAAYLPPTIAIKLPKGMLSFALQVHFVNASPQPLVRLAGEIALEQIDLRDGANSPLLALQHASAVLNDVEPLSSAAAFGPIRLDGLTANVVRNHDGSLNLTTLMAKGGATAGSGRAAGGVQPQPHLAAQNQPPNAAAQPQMAPASPVPQSSPTLPSSTPQPTAAPHAAASSTTVPGNHTLIGQHAVPIPSPAVTSSTFSTPKPTATSHAGASPSTALRNPAVVAPPASPVASGSVTPSATLVQTASSTGSSANVSVQTLTVAGSTVNVTDNSGAKPATLALEDIHVLIKDLHTTGTTPATLDMGASLSGGGSIAAKGTLDLPQSNVMTDITLNQVDLPALQAFAQSVLAAEVASGKLTLHCHIHTNYATHHFNFHLEPASLELDQVQVRAPEGGENPVSWSKLTTTIAELDLATRQVTVNEVRGDGLHLFVRREHDGQISLASLMRGAASSMERPATPPPVSTRMVQRRVRPARGSVPRRHHASNLRAARAAPESRPRAKAPPSTTSAARTAAMRAPWQFHLGSLLLATNYIHVIDNSQAQAVDLTITPLNLHVVGASSDLNKPVKLEVDGIVNHGGSFKVEGNATPQPLKAELRVVTRRLNLAVANPYVASHLNATIARAVLTMNGAFAMADERGRTLMRYRGDVMLGNVRMLDKVTFESFARWGAFNARRVNFELGRGKPRIEVAALSLADFYGRLILYGNGRMNLSDIKGSPQAPPVSLTRVNPAIAPQPLAPPTPSPSGEMSTAAAKSAEPLPADIAIGGITLAGGHINYTDNFIKPNYSANLTRMTGHIGSFGTASTAPAEVELHGQVSGTAPLAINGSVNPLAPIAFVDISAKADGVELTPLTPYSSKYTGYPITQGMLSVNVHYLLNQNNLTAQNHILIDQLTFGPKVESPSVLNLPIRLAVALLKNPQGQIDLDIPVSGSLSDPNFSIGAVILNVLKNLILKVATAPFKLLASVVGGIGGNEQLEYVEFKPGYATLSPDSQNKLDKLAKALEARPALRLDISGRVDPTFDRDGLREAMLEHLVKQQKVKQLEDEGETVDRNNVKLSQAEYNKYLRRVYKAAKFDKPRDFLGLNKSVPPDEEKKLLLSQTKVTDKDLEQLADNRADSVRQWLSAKVAPTRLFIIAPKLNAEGIKDHDKTTRADLSLD